MPFLVDELAKFPHPFPHFPVLWSIRGLPYMTFWHEVGETKSESNFSDVVICENPFLGLKQTMAALWVSKLL